MNNFDYSYHEVLTLTETNNLLQHLIHIEKIMNTFTGSVWSYRNKPFGLFSPDYLSHRVQHHVENSYLDLNSLLQNPSVSYLLRKDLNNWFDMSTVLASLRVKRISQSAKVIQNLLISDRQYTMPFHLDPYDTLILFPKG